jgi:hypothetical protein
MGTNIYIEVEVPVSDITGAGYHHEDDCTGPEGFHDGDECRADVYRSGLTAMHTEHHLGPFWLCRVHPCRDIT